MSNFVQHGFTNLLSIDVGSRTRDLHNVRQMCPKPKVRFQIASNQEAPPSWKGSYARKDSNFEHLGRRRYTYIVMLYVYMII